MDFEGRILPNDWIPVAEGVQRVKRGWNSGVKLVSRNMRVSFRVSVRVSVRGIQGKTFMALRCPWGHQQRSWESISGHYMRMHK